MILYEKHRSGLKDDLYHQNDINLNFPAHLHNSFEFVYVLSGTLNVIIDEKKYTLNRGDATIILPNQIHSYQTLNNSKSYLCVFSNSFVYDYYESVKDKIATDPVFSFNDLELVDLMQKSKSVYLKKSYLYYIIDLFDRNTHYEKRNIKLYDNISSIISYIEQNFSNDITVKDIAVKIGYDYHYLTNLIQKVLHTKFRNLLNDYRIQHAVYLLQTTSLTITEIASTCGYDSLCTFNRNFKQITNKTPSEYRFEK